MAERGIKSVQLSELTGLHKNTISKLRKEVPRHLDTETLDRLCNALQCQPGDLIVYVEVK